MKKSIRFVIHEIVFLSLFLFGCSPTISPVPPTLMSESTKISLPTDSPTPIEKSLPTQTLPPTHTPIPTRTPIPPTATVQIPDKILEYLKEFRWFMSTISITHPEVGGASMLES